MKSLGLNEIREKYLCFFESKQHLRIKSFPLIPQNDKSLLLINAGMVPFKPYFTGQLTPPSPRVTSCQKCIRTNDIENVGKTSRHCTFFEMLGNFSFGDYFKDEIIPWSWEFLTEVMEIPADLLYPTIYLEDDEAENIWINKVGLPKEKITKLGKDDNFWELGVGPCGPDSEIFYDRGIQNGCGKPDCAPGCECDRFIEIWNLVFTQFDQKEDGTYERLEKTNIDTGMGLERISMVMQGVDSVFEIDTFRRVIEEICKISGVAYGQDLKNDTSIRIITDHVRAIVFMTADGIIPSNEGRGYVLRRLLRRAARHGKLIGINFVFLSKLCELVIEIFKGAYPELDEKRDYILKFVSVEEQKFYETIDQGMTILNDLVSKIKADPDKIITGGDLFKLYDTYGFPIDLTKEILDESGIPFDETAFYNEMNHQRERTRAARETTNFMGADETVYNKLPSDISTEFVGYSELSGIEAKIIALVAEGVIASEAHEGNNVSVFTNTTPFYAKSGGQAGDIGTISTETGTIEISDCYKVSGDNTAHIGIVKTGIIKTNDTAIIDVDVANRKDIARNHSATHLLQKVLRDTLGSHVQQAGSSVASDRLRFDFTHFSPLTDEQLKDVEIAVNNAILSNLPAVTEQKTIEEAREMGAMALFGEKYGDIVRVVKLGDYSTELCGGTHVNSSAEIGSFKILSETGIAAGVRRIEAVTGRGVLAYYRGRDELLSSISKLAKTTPDNLIKRIELILNEAREYSKELEALRTKIAGNTVEQLIVEKQTFDGIDTVFANISGMDTEALRELGDKIRDRLAVGLIMLASEQNGKVNLVSMATKNATQLGVHAGNIIKAAAAIVGGGGGGRPDMAQAGGKNTDKIHDALEKARDTFLSQIRK